MQDLEVLKKVLTENKDNLVSTGIDLKMNEDIQKFVDAVYEKADKNMGKYN